MTKGTGTSLGGRIIHTRKPKPKERNPSPCPTCGAGKGQPCFRVVSGNVKELRRLHHTPAPAKKPSTRSEHARQAYKDAQDLGPIIPFHPTRLRGARGIPVAANLYTGE